MARSVDTLFQLMQTEKNTMSYIKDKLTNPDGTTTIKTEQELLTELQSTNPVGIWRLWQFLTAVEMNFLEQNWDEIRTEIEDIKASAFIGGKEWWVEKCEEWQNGDFVIIDPDNYSIHYDIIDENKQLIKHATISEIGGKVILKVQKEYETPINLLSTAELESFTSYVNKVKFAGTRINIWNFNPDLLHLEYTIYYDPLINISTITTNVEKVIGDYIQNLPFDSEFSKTELTNLLQDVEGVISPVFTFGEGKTEGGNYVEFDNYYTGIAGFCAIDPAFPLLTSINYISKIK